MDTDRTYQALDQLRSALPDLGEALTPGTRRRWTQRDLTPEQRRRMDARAVIEREAKAYNLSQGIKALGDGRAPLDIHVLDLLADIATAVAKLEKTVTNRLGLTTICRASTAERISRLITLLDAIAGDGEMSAHVQAEAVRLARAASHAIGDAEPVHRLDARCPICDATSLRAFPERDVVVCINTACQCDSEDCACQWDRPRRHRWPYDQWPLLAQVLHGNLGEAS